MASEQQIPKHWEVENPTDYSADFLDALLGPNWDTFGTQALGGGEYAQASELILTIMSAFNTISLVAVAALFGWMIIVSVIGTAHEGIAFGKKYSSIWVPIRFVGAMGALAPIFKGLSLFQIALLALLGWSINMGNYVWNAGVDYFVENGGQITVQAPSYPTESFSHITDGILTSLTIQKYLTNQRMAEGFSDSGGEWKFEEGLFDKSYGKYTYYFANHLGKVIIECPEKSDPVCSAKKNAVDAAVSSLEPLATALADTETSIDAIKRDELSKAAQQVHTVLLQGLKEKAESDNHALKGKLEDFQTRSKQAGWYMAGSSYWAISWLNQSSRASMYSGFEYSAPSRTIRELEGISAGVQDYGAIKLRLENYLKTAYGARSGVSEVMAEPDKEGDNVVVRFLRSQINQLFAWILPSAIEMLCSHDPVASLSSVGDYLSAAAWSLYIASIPIAKVAGEDFGPHISVVLFAIATPLALYGIILAYFLPAIPFIRWMAGIASWVILIINSLVAAPLWLIAHALPEGEGAAGQHGKRGYLLFLGVLIRPSLMVTGFFIAMLLINVIGKLIGQSFLVFVGDQMQFKTFALVGMISILVLIGIVVMTLANRFFGLIEFFPSQVMDYIGQQIHSLNEEKDVAGAKGAFSGSTNIITGVGGVGGGILGKGGGKGSGKGPAKTDNTMQAAHQ